MLRLFETREQKEDKANREAAELELMIRGANAHLDSALLDVTCKKAIKAWGPEKQKWVAAEELSELIHALARNNRGDDNLENIVEEIADVEIVLHQLKIMFDCYDAVDHQRTKRLCELRVRADENTGTRETNNPHGNAQAACKSS
jgi:NTP pyrophosphatase (non-canonical NTP hydrolase)